MLKTERTCVMNFENAIRGARNPMNSWEKSDSYYDKDHNFVLGENDLNLAKRLCAAGSDHRKFIRQIFVSVDITAPCIGGRSLIHTRSARLQIRRAQCPHTLKAD